MQPHEPPSYEPGTDQIEWEEGEEKNDQTARPIEHSSHSDDKLWPPNIPLNC